MEAVTPDLSKAQFKEYQRFINDNCGIHIDEFRSDALRVGLCIRMRELGVDDYGTYLALLQNGRAGEAEFKQLLNLITINETSFFRNPAQFAALKRRVLPEIIKRKENKEHKLRIWSAGCSSGEEPYSIAMTLLDILPRPGDWQIDILGTDISHQALAQAERGVFGERSVRDADSYYLRRYFYKEGDTYIMDDKIKEMVRFGYHNMVKEPYPFLIIGGWDIIFCRNVTIYFKLPVVKHVIDNFYRSLNEDGYLFIGHAETLYQISDKFEPIEMESAFVYRKVKKPAAETRGPDRAPAVVVPIRPRQATKTAPAPPEPRAEALRAEEEQMFNEARERFRAEDFVASEVLLKKVLKINPANMGARLLAAQVHLNNNRYDEALTEVEKVLSEQPTSAKAHYLRGVIFEKQGRYSDAVKELKKVIYLDRDFALAHLNLAGIYRVQGLESQALREYNNAVRSLSAKPHGDWVDFAGGFFADVFIEACRRNIKQLGRTG